MIIQNLEIPKTKFIVAVSGGADSLCLTLLAAESASKSRVEMIAVFVDHRLRPESSCEILPVIEVLEERGINTMVLTWKHSPISGNIEKRAREARYELLTSFCHETNAESMLVAHHSLDQWETFFMRLSRGSALTGLSAIKPQSEYNGIKVIRPLLQYSKEDLAETLNKRFNIRNYIKDPMNSDSQYERVRWRQGYEQLAAFGLGNETINRSIARLQRAEECLENLAKIGKDAVFSNGYILINTFKTYHIELQIRILKSIIESLTQKKNRIISYSLLERLAKEIVEKNFVASNISGCIFRRDKTKNINVSIESRKL